jgi:hypothetical protein
VPWRHARRAGSDAGRRARRGAPPPRPRARRRGPRRSPSSSDGTSSARGASRSTTRRSPTSYATYLERQFGLRAPEMTTEEFLLDDARATPPRGGASPAARRVPGRVRLVKFARHHPTIADSERAWDAAARFVAETSRAAEDRPCGWLIPGSSSSSRSCRSWRSAARAGRSVAVRYPTLRDARARSRPRARRTGAPCSACCAAAALGAAPRRARAPAGGRRDDRVHREGSTSSSRSTSPAACSRRTSRSGQAREPARRRARPSSRVRRGPPRGPRSASSCFAARPTRSAR